MLFFVDESGHDRKVTPYEVRGGLAIPEQRCWPLIEAIGFLELEIFGLRLHSVGIEWKGANLLKPGVFKQGAKRPPIEKNQRRDLARDFLRRQHRASIEKSQTSPRGLELIALNQAFVAFSHGVIDLLVKNQIGVFAAVIAPDAPKYPQGNFLRRDYRFLLDRFAMWTLQSDKRNKAQRGILVFDEEDKTACRRLGSVP